MKSLIFNSGNKNIDDFIKESLIIEVGQQKVDNGTYEIGTFDIVLAPAK